jgi:hypothetical protein
VEIPIPDILAMSFIIIPITISVPPSKPGGHNIIIMLKQKCVNILPPAKINWQKSAAFFAKEID